MSDKQHPHYAQVVNLLKQHSVNIASISEKVDITAFDNALDPDWFMIDSAGRRVSKQEELDALRKSEFKPSSIRLSDLEAEVHGDTAIVTGLSDVVAHFQGKDISGRYRFTQIYRAPGAQTLVDHVARATAPALPTNLAMITCIAMQVA